MRSRAHTPALPPYSPLTPTHEHDNEGQQFLELCHFEANSADLSSIMATKIEQDAQDLPAALSEIMHFQQTESDRMAEFEEATARARQAARNDPAKTDTEQPEGEGSKRALTGHEAYSDSPEPREDAKNGGEDIIPPNSEQDATPVRVQAPWISDAVSACQTNKKNPLNTGNVLVILDVETPATSCLIDLSAFDTSGALKRLQQDAQKLSEGCISEQGLAGLLILSSSSSPIPELLPVALDTTTIESLRPDNIHPSPAGTAKTRAAINARAKETSTQSSASVVPDTDWIRAYDSFFRIIAGKSGHRVPKGDFNAALPKIESIISIAQKYDAVHVVQNAFSRLLVGYVENHTLYSTIAKEPIRCLIVGVALQCRLVYDEAFKHLVGSNANLRAGKPYDGLPTDVQARVQSRSHELYDKRMHTMMRLMGITLPAEKKKKTKSASADYPTEVVSQHEQPKAYCMVNIFRDWTSEHVAYLNNETSENAHESYLCAHETGCDTVAGFFRTIMTGGDLYLPAEKVLEDWEHGSIRVVNDRDNFEDVAKKSLAALKATASEYVKDLVGSELQLRDRYALDYLTCVKVGSDDVPWTTEYDEEMDED